MEYLRLARVKAFGLQAFLEVIFVLGCLRMRRGSTGLLRRILAHFSGIANAICIQLPIFRWGLLLL